MPTALLVADDSPTIRKIVELTFADTDVRVRAVGGGEQVFEEIESLQPDVIVADVGLSGVDGYELCRRVKRSGRPVPVGLLVGTFDRVDPERMEECGADGHLGKPFESAALVDWVHRLLEPPAAEPEEPETVEDEPVDDRELLAPEHAEAAVADDTGEAAATPPPAGDAPELSEALVEAVARRVMERLSEQVVREMAREIIPEVASEIVRERIRELENE